MSVAVASRFRGSAVREPGQPGEDRSEPAPFATARSSTNVVGSAIQFRQVVPDSLEFCWTMLTEATSLQGCRLEIEQVPATVNCRACDATTMLDVPILLCGSCGGADVTLVTGEEFMVVSLELAKV